MLVSIIIPCYNVAPYVARALDSALAQTYTDTEIICVDNNSTDETLAILEDYQKRFPAKIQVYKESIQGAPAARNLGLKHAKGEWLQFLDADDEIFPNKLTKQVELTKQYPNVSIIISGCKVISPANQITVLTWLEGDPYLALFFSDLGNTLTNLWKTKDVRAVGGWNNAFRACQEDELMTRMILAEMKFVIDNEILAIIHQRQNSISYQSQNYSYFNYKLRSFWYEKINLSPEYEDYRTAIEQRFFHIIKMYSRVDKTTALQAFQTYFPNLYESNGDVNEGLFYYAVKYFGYKIALRSLRLLHLLKS